MIYEFALDPALVATWHDRLEYLYYEEKFGVQTRRIASTYPKEWKEMVWGCIDGKSIGQMARKRLEVILLDVLNGSIRRASTFPELSDWLERAEKEHDQRPFRAILSSNNPRSNLSVIESTALFEEGHDLWGIPELETIPRTPKDIAEAVRPILQFCKKVVFIEPFFSTKKSFINTLRELFQSIWSYRIAGSDPIVQIQAKLDNKAEHADSYGFLSECEKHLEKIIPLGKKVTLTIKKSKTGQQRFHNRYILTDSIGVGIPSGLTDTTDSKIETDDFYVLSSEQHKERWLQYVSSTSSPYEILAQLVIVGIGH